MTEAIQLIPCFLCGSGAEIRKTKVNKPCFTCTVCGVQTFIRGRRAVELFAKLRRTLAGADIAQPGEAGTTMEVQALANRREELKAKLKEVQSRMPLLGQDQGLNVIANTLQKEIYGVEKRLAEIGKR
ncbi:MAG: hypothetical protein EDM79_13840 [Chloroflexi bacterium]|nr:MAG: hypothetical protein EDM79_13840 [Chloroflexota bacterium]